jgi:hypothetical protein
MGFAAIALSGRDDAIFRDRADLSPWRVDVWRTDDGWHWDIGEGGCCISWSQKPRISQHAARRDALARLVKIAERRLATIHAALGAVNREDANL